MFNSMGSAVVFETIPGERCANVPVFMFISRDSVVAIEILCCVSKFSMVSLKDRKPVSLNHGSASECGVRSVRVLG